MSPLKLFSRLKKSKNIRHPVAASFDASPATAPDADTDFFFSHPLYRSPSIDSQCTLVEPPVARQVIRRARVDRPRSQFTLGARRVIVCN
ncbi:hypothetical protein GGI25_003833 [Coemansia spiralis]|uniref:Uncharacterized protein n=2 Tax=Coemansia TaxID=4863 RepID=A0A9W8KXN4_9FUNG|nr:hypothetical protein EDC05_003700 [Coemansia umbellata]KAJ2620990.1 hypothetical protein GGI26_004490 [Coemansia sp. RSA 1358]KAJ2675739.1 hypothetical protein GGI25_003833 [Coemansia spiralis]